MRRPKIKNMRIKSQGKCDATGKTKYPDAEAAEAGLMHIWSHDPSAKLIDMHVYQCPSCHQYHIGHISAYQKQLERQNGSNNHQANGS